MCTVTLKYKTDTPRLRPPPERPPPVRRRPAAATPRDARALDRRGALSVKVLSLHSAAGVVL